METYWNWFGPSLVVITPLFITSNIIFLITKGSLAKKVWQYITYTLAVIYIAVMASLVIAPVIFIINI